MFICEEDMAVTENAELISAQPKETYSSPSPRIRSIQEVLDEGGFTPHHGFFLVAFGIIAMADAMQATCIAVILPQIKCDWQLGPMRQALIAAASFGGSGVGGIVVGYFSDRFGRKVTCLVITVLFFISMVLTAVSSSAWTFSTFSAISGFCSGGSFAIVYTFWAEICPESHRRVGVMLITLLAGTGTCAAVLIAFLVLNVWGWKIYIGFLSTPALLPIVILAFLPESPKYLSATNKVKRLNKALMAITQISEDRLNSITLKNEPGIEENRLVSVFTTMCRVDYRAKTTKLIFVEACLQTMHVGLAFVYTTMIAKNYCEMGTGKGGGLVPAAPAICSTLTNGDLMNTLILSTVMFPSTVITALIANWMGDLTALRIASMGTLVTICLLLICMGRIIMFVTAYMFAFFIAGQHLILYKVVPELYPTMSRNTSFGVVGGIGKILGAFVIFGLTVVLDFSIRACLALFIPTAITQIMFIVHLKLDRPENDEPDELSVTDDDSQKDS